MCVKLWAQLPVLPATGEYGGYRPIFTRTAQATQQLLEVVGCHIGVFSTRRICRCCIKRLCRWYAGAKRLKTRTAKKTHTCSCAHRFIWECLSYFNLCHYYFDMKDSTFIWKILRMEYLVDILHNNFRLAIVVLFLSKTHSNISGNNTGNNAINNITRVHQLQLKIILFIDINYFQ